MGSKPRPPCCVCLCPLCPQAQVALGFLRGSFRLLVLVLGAVIFGLEEVFDLAPALPSRLLRLLWSPGVWPCAPSDMSGMGTGASWVGGSMWAMGQNRISNSCMCDSLGLKV